MVVTGRFGVKTYSLENPTKPKLLDELSAERLKLEGDPDVDFGPPDTSAPVSTFWQNEDMDVDQDRKLLILSRDPRAYAGTTNNSPATRAQRARRTSPASTSSTRATRRRCAC